MALLRQPMVHFLLGGAVIFALFGAIGSGGEAPQEPARGAPDPRIVVTRGQVESLAQGFAGRWRRAPTDVELAALVAEHVREEMLVREALALALDRDDVVIRRHLRTRMEFLAQDIGTLNAPTDDDLRALLAAEAVRFRQRAVLSFRHVFLDPAPRGEVATQAEAQRLLARLQNPDTAAAAEEDGDRFLPGYAFRDRSTPQIGRTFGDGFAAALEEAPLGRWHGPLTSAYGLHLVHVDGRSEANLPPLDEVAPALRAEWAARQRRQAIESFMAALRSRYIVSVEEPAAATPPRP